MQTTRSTASKAYAVGLRAGSALFMVGFTPTDLLFGVRWDRNHFTAHLGLFMLGAIWGLDGE